MSAEIDAAIEVMDRAMDDIAELRCTVADLRADELKRFRALLRAMVSSELPSCIDQSDYDDSRRISLYIMWSHNPARAFLRLTDADQRKVLQYLGGDNA